MFCIQVQLGFSLNSSCWLTQADRLLYNNFLTLPAVCPLWPLLFALEMRPHYTEYFFSMAWGKKSVILYLKFDLQQKQWPCIDFSLTRLHLEVLPHRAQDGAGHRIHWWGSDWEFPGSGPGQDAGGGQHSTGKCIWKQMTFLCIFYFSRPTFTRQKYGLSGFSTVSTLKSLWRVIGTNMKFISEHRDVSLLLEMRSNSHIWLRTTLSFVFLTQSNTELSKSPPPSFMRRSAALCESTGNTFHGGTGGKTTFGR